MSNSTALARSIIKQLIELGIKDVVLSPGSRNAPLSIALYEASEKGLIDLHVRIDERGAAFFALGISKASSRYVPVVCTSGTAVANYYPALLEAHHSDINLLLLTADRPARLRRTGSNQTTDQSNIFGAFVRTSLDTDKDLDLSTALSGSGPVHINLQFDEPLLNEDNSDWLSGIKVKSQETGKAEVIEINIESKKSLVIVGHDRAGFSVDEIEKFASDLAAPLIAEDTLVFEDAIAHAPIVLSDEKARIALAAENVFVIGRTTLSRSINAYIQGAKKVIVIDPRTENIDTSRTSDEIYTQIPRVKMPLDIDQNWHDLWKKYEALAAIALSVLPEWSEAELATIIAEELEDDTALFISSSRPVRDFESFAVPRSGLNTYANRGLAGIDGNISTALGIATQHSESYAVIGDLAFLHDISALANPTQDNLTIIVVDNDGGGIFSTLGQRGSKGFETIFGTPHGIDIASVVKSFGISSQQISSAKELHIALQQIHSGLHVIVAKMPDREQNADFIAAVLNKYSQLVLL
ncbi:MAG: 2-succinyl-5-enolpyruvyl-6-hydroxy-3-cyclohexene-1-carboxylic-acid synthase [Actinobacteria bacterium]|nr:2-succinyl-5-enolpyruvyl-6-hydroxy-3-cyclohexene-1-carboxylic-acid synthase [Actinomycetota bacterium]